jgi:competence protein ComGC
MNRQKINVMKRTFSLLELLIVLAIMVTMTSMTLSLFENSDIELRYQRTVSKLKDIERAMLGDPSIVANVQRQLSGYVVDMGRPPESISDLYNQDVNFASWNPEYPVGSGNVLTEIELLKGKRGSYLSSLPGAAEFRDGWGRPDQGNGDHGWELSWNRNWAVLGDPYPIVDVNVESLGADGAIGGIQYDEDLELKIDKNDWSCDVLNMKVEIQDPSEYIKSQHPTEEIRALLLCYYKIDNTINTQLVESPAAIFNPSGNVYTISYDKQDVYMGQHPIVLTHGPPGSGNILNDRHQKPIFNISRFYPRSSPPEKIVLVVP